MRNTGMRGKGTGYRVQGIGYRSVEGIWTLVLCLLIILTLQGCGGGGSDGGCTAACGCPGAAPCETCSQKVDSQLTSSWSAYDKGDYNSALSLFNAGLTLCSTDTTVTDSQFAQLYSGMGYSNFKLNDMTNAKASFTSATQKSSSLTEAYAGLALVADAQDSYTEMIDNVVKLESLPVLSFTHSPNIKMVDMYVIAARGYLASDDVCSFKKYYDKAKAADPNHVSVKRLTEFYNTYSFPQLSSCPVIAKNRYDQGEKSEK